MIFATVGTQIAFDRMMAVVDDWAGSVSETVFAQVGPTSRKFSNLQTAPFLGPDEFEQSFARADLIVAHAGMGSILSALALGKPIIIMPRRASLGEHRNEHQVATARRLATLQGVSVAWDESELRELLNKRGSIVESGTTLKISESAPEKFLLALKELVDA